MIWSIIAVILVVLVIITVLVLVMLLFPVTIYINSTRFNGRIDGSLSIRWVMLLFRYTLRDRLIEILLFNRRIKREYHKKKIPEPERPEKMKKMEVLRGIPPISDTLNLIVPILRLLKGIIHAFRLKYLNIDVTFGFEDPAYTGMLTGLLYAANSSYMIGHNIRFTPEFTEPVLDWDMRTEISITPVKLIVPVARFVTSVQVLKSGLRVIRG